MRKWLYGGSWPHQTLVSGLAASVVVAPTSLLLGGLTSFGQTYLPEWINSASNSAGGWTAVAFLLVWLSRAGRLLAALLGVVAFELLNEGYGVVSGWRGYFYAAPFSTVWSVVGLVAGPILGYAAALTRYGTPTGRVLGVAVPAAVGLGEGAWSLGAVADSTGATFWVVEMIVSGAAFISMTAWARLPLKSTLATTGIWLLGAACFFCLLAAAGTG